jgi:hypothetical protein
MKIFLPLLLLLSFQSNALEYYLDEKSPGILTVQGEFNQDDVNRFTKQVLTNDVHTVVFNSTGGDFMVSIKIGKFVREQNLNTLISDNKSCVSACAYAFMGGVERTVDKDARFAMHRPYFNESIPGSYNEGYDTGIVASVMVTTYLIKMGLDPLTASLHLIGKKLVRFSPKQQADLNIITASK